MSDYRIETDFLGQKAIPAHALWGIHTARAMENFPYLTRPAPAALIAAYGQVKLACLSVCAELGCWQDNSKIEAMLAACREMAAGALNDHIRVDMMQGGAGTSLNMNVNEVLANRALQILSLPLGQYDIVNPLDDINRYQSTNDTFPTALKVAAIQMIGELEKELVGLQEAFQDKEKAFAEIVKVGRTEYQDAALITLGREMGAYAEAINRDRWRVYKCVERLRVVNLGGTAIGTGLGAERHYIFRVAEKLSGLCGLPLARAENLIDATQNADVFAETSGILKACACSLLKICSDLRFLASGPDAGIGELNLPARQAGSSIMPGKVNPVIPESASQAAMQVIGNDMVIGQAVAAGHLELNPFLPLIASGLLDSIDLLTTACRILNRYCVSGLTANVDRCARSVDCATAAATALLPAVGYQKACQIAQYAKINNKTIRQAALELGLLTKADLDLLLSAEAVCRLGFVKRDTV